MYLFQGLGPRGLGREADERLNVRLRRCVAQLGHGLRLAKQWPDDIVAAEQMQVFTYLMGLLLLFHTRRLKSLGQRADDLLRSEEHTSELKSLMRISYAVLCLKKKTQ